MSDKNWVLVNSTETGNSQQITEQLDVVGGRIYRTIVAVENSGKTISSSVALVFVAGSGK